VSGESTAPTEADHLRRIEHLNAVLRAIRNVNQLIVVEKNAQRLITAACEQLVETRGYQHAWIALTPPDGPPRRCAAAGLDEGEPSFTAAIERGDLPRCCDKLDGQPQLVVADPVAHCEGCPLGSLDRDRSRVVTALCHLGRPHGVLGLALPARYADDAEELSLIQEVAADLGLALHGIEEQEARQRAEAELRLMDTVFEASLTAISTAGLDGIIDHVNPAFLELWGYPSKEVALGNSIASFFAHPEEAAQVLEALNSTGRWRGEFAAVRADGSHFVARGLATVVCDAAGEVVGYQSACLDVTAERAAIEGLRLKDAIFEASLAAQSAANAEGIIEHVNPAFLELWGYERKEDAVGHSVASFFVNADDAGPVLEALNTTGRWRGEFLAKRTDGSTFISRGFATVVRDEAGERVGYQSANLDVTGERQAQERLGKLFTAVTGIVDSLLDGPLADDAIEQQVLDACLSATDSRYGMIGRINELGRFDTTTYSSATLEACAFPEAQAWDLTTGMELRGVWGAPMVRGKPVLCNDLEAHPDRVGQPQGHVPILCFVGVPLRVDGKVGGMVAVANKPGGYSAWDQEALERLATTLMLARHHRQALRRVAERTAQLEAANHELESFAYSVSHDLRGPLRAMEGFSQALIEDYLDRLDDTAQDYLQRVIGEARRMAQLIDDLLELSRVARAELEPKRVNLASVARDIIAGLRRAEPERRAEVVIPKALSVRGDPRLLRQVLDNLLGNAWKFTAPRPVAQIELGARDHDGARAYFVRDNGVGFDPEHASKLFTPFERLHGMTEFPGNGIGLSTVKRIVHRHAGRVWYQSALDKGATFFFTLYDDPEEGETND